MDKCECEPGFYDDGTEICKECGGWCETCHYDALTCTSCTEGSNRETEDCSCKPGFYDVFNEVCPPCSEYCATCEG